jgi:hypothetical protein
MSRVIIYQLPDTQSPEETLLKVKQNPSLIYDILGYGYQNILQDAKIICFDSSLMIPTVEAPTYAEAECLVKNQKEKTDFFEYDGFTFATMNHSDFKLLSDVEQNDFVNKFMDALSLQTCKVKELSVYSLASLAAVTVIEQSSIIDPGLSNENFFDGRRTEGNEINSITFQPISSENTDIYVTSLEIEVEPNLIIDQPDSIVFDIDEQTSSSILEIFNGSDIENAHNFVVDDTELKRYDDIEYPFDEDIDVDPYDNFDIL